MDRGWVGLGSLGLDWNSLGCYPLSTQPQCWGCCRRGPGAAILHGHHLRCSVAQPDLLLDELGTRLEAEQCPTAPWLHAATAGYRLQSPCLHPESCEQRPRPSRPVPAELPWTWQLMAKSWQPLRSWDSLANASFQKQMAVLFLPLVLAPFICCEERNCCCQGNRAMTSPTSEEQMLQWLSGCLHQSQMKERTCATSLLGCAYTFQQEHTRTFSFPAKCSAGLFKIPAHHQVAYVWKVINPLQPL